MIRSEFLEKDRRAMYLRYVVNILVNRYLINQAKLAHELGFSPQYLREFSTGVRGMRHPNLTKLEDMIIDLYSALLENEVPDSEEELERFIDTL